jgi:hypothetical protein
VFDKLFLWQGRLRRVLAKGNPISTRAAGRAVAGRVE